MSGEKVAWHSRSQHSTAQYSTSVFGMRVMLPDSIPSCSQVFCGKRHEHTHIERGTKQDTEKGEGGEEAINGGKKGTKQ